MKNIYLFPLVVVFLMFNVIEVAATNRIDNPPPSQETIVKSLKGANTAIVDDVLSNDVEDCRYDGVPLYGKVKIVDSFADFDVRIVDVFPDLKVQVVDVVPDACGKWQFVDVFPDFTIRFVGAFEGFSIKYVDVFPGMP